MQNLSHIKMKQAGNPIGDKAIKAFDIVFLLIQTKLKIKNKTMNQCGKVYGSQEIKK